MNTKKIAIRCFVVQAIVAAVSVPTGLLADDGIIWEAGANETIKLAERDASGPGENDHPVDLNVDDVSTALGSLKIRNKRDSDKLDPVFTVEQVSVLSRSLAKGLADAGPNQDIHFVLQKTVKRRFGLKPRRYYVAGKAFYADRGLNIIIGDYDRPADAGFEAAYDPTQVGIVRYHFDHGSRAKSSDAIKAPVASVQGIQNKQIGNATRTDWFVIDVQTASAAWHPIRATDAQEAQAAKPKEPDDMPDEPEVIPAPPAAAAPAVVKSPGSTEEPEPAAAQKPVPGGRSFEDRLRTLDRLKDEGLITEAEYAAKRKQILDEL